MIRAVTVTVSASSSARRSLRNTATGGPRAALAVAVILLSLSGQPRSQAGMHSLAGKLEAPQWQPEARTCRHSWASGGLAGPGRDRGTAASLLTGASASGHATRSKSLSLSKMLCIVQNERFTIEVDSLLNSTWNAEDSVTLFSVPV